MATKTIPEKVMNALRIGKPGIVSEWALLEAGKCLGVVNPDVKTFKNRPFLREKVIDALDAYDPDWRGYKVEYVQKDSEDRKPGHKTGKIPIQYNENLFYLTEDRKGSLQVLSDFQIQRWYASDSPKLNGLKILKSGTNGQMVLLMEQKEEAREMYSKVS